MRTRTLLDATIALTLTVFATGCSAADGTSVSSPAGAPDSADEAEPAAAADTETVTHGPQRSWAESNAPIGIYRTLTGGALTWSRTAGSAGFDAAYAVASDASSNVIVGGALGGAADIGCGEYTPTALGAYVATYSSEGACAHATYFDGDDVAPSGVAVDGDGAVYVTGLFAGTATFGGVPYTSAGGYDGFVVKLTPGGDVVWVKTFGAAEDEYPFTLSVRGGRVAVGGAFYGTPTLAGSVASNAGDADAFVLELAGADGASVGSQVFGAGGWDAVNGLAFAADGRLIVTGTFAHTVTFGGTPLTSAGAQDGFVSIFDATLAPTNTLRFGGEHTDSARSAVVGGDGRIHVIGYVGGEAMSYDAFLTTYSSDLTALGSTTMEGSIAEAIALHPSGGVAVAGRKGTDAFVATYDATGAQVWRSSITGDGAEALGVTVSSAGNVVATGMFSGTVGLGGSGTVAAGAADTFLVRFTE